MYTSFPALCSRVFSQVYREQQLLASYPVQQLAAIPRFCVDRLHQWVNQQVGIDAEDDFRARYIEMIHELQIPMGGRLQSQRRLVTRDEQSGAVTILERELGYDTSLRLTEMARLKPRDIAADPTHDNFPSLMLTMFNLRLSQTKKTNFISDYMVLPTAFSMLDKLAKTKQFERKEAFGHLRAPLVTLLQRSWMVHFRETWWKCDSATDAVLGWLRFIVEQYEGEIPNSAGINIKQHFYLPFFEESLNMDE